MSQSKTDCSKGSDHETTSLAAGSFTIEPRSSDQCRCFHPPLQSAVKNNLESETGKHQKYITQRFFTLVRNNSGRFHTETHSRRVMHLRDTGLEALNANTNQ